MPRAHREMLRCPRPPRGVSLLYSSRPACDLPVLFLFTFHAALLERPDRLCGCILSSPQKKIRGQHPPVQHAGAMHTTHLIHGAGTRKGTHVGFFPMSCMRRRSSEKVAPVTCQPCAMSWSHGRRATLRDLVLRSTIDDTLSSRAESDVLTSHFSGRNPYRLGNGTGHGLHHGLHQVQDTREHLAKHAVGRLAGSDDFHSVGAAPTT